MLETSKKQKQLKKQLGNGYHFEQYYASNMVENALKMRKPSGHFLVAASLTVGVVKLEAVLYWSGGKYQLGYDLMVKDTKDSLDWICYDSLPDAVRLNARHLEREMFQVLNRAVERYGLSYTECRFPKLDGVSPKLK